MQRNISRKKKRDRFKSIFGLGRSASPIGSQVSKTRASITTQAQAPTSSSSFTNLILAAVPTSLPSTPDIAVASKAFSQATLPPLSIQTNLLPSSAQATPPPPSASSKPARDLWSDALNMLSKNEQQKLREILPISGPLSETIDEMVRVTKEKQYECDEKRYKISFQGKKIILRDLAERTIFWLNKFKEVGDIAVNFDPVHAALPWAGVRFLLQVAVGGHEQMAALLLSVQEVTYLVSRCAIYERLYSLETILDEGLENFHGALVNLYTAILRVIALSYELVDKNSVTRGLYALINPSQVSEHITKCQVAAERVEIEAQNCERVRSKSADNKTHKFLEILQTPVLRTDERISSILEKVDDKDRLQILDWISLVLYGKHHASIKEKRTANTCDWLLRHSVYRQWRDESSSIILWLHGTAGTGKTYLTSRVIDEIQDSLNRNPNSEGFAYFYCNRNEAERRRPLSVLLSFIRQLSTVCNKDHEIQTRLRKYYNETRQKNSEPTMGECKELLFELLNLYPKTTLILDALDECEKGERTELIELFEKYVDYTSKPVKFFISSRPDGDIREILRSKSNVEIQAADNYDDISKFVKSRITKHRRWNKMSVPLREEITGTLQKSSQGMFQWAFLQIEQLLKLMEEEEIRERLGKLPIDLKKAYDEICSRMNETENLIANRAFRWVMCACYPLPTEVLLLAVSQDEENDNVKLRSGLDEDLLLEYCQNMLVIDPVQKVWIPSHLSVIEYFETYRWSQIEANCLVSRACLVLLNNFAKFSRKAVENIGWRILTENYSLDGRNFDPIIGYAAHHWMIHVRRCEEADNMELLAPMTTQLKKFLGSAMNSSHAYRSWFNLIPNGQSILRQFSYSYRDFRHIKPTSVPAFGICYFGICNTISDWWKVPWTGYRSMNEAGLSLLSLAVLGKSTSVCRRLIGLGVEVNEQLQGDMCGSALAFVSSHDNIEVVELLLQSGADVNMQLLRGNCGSALAAAVGAAYRNYDIVDLLLKSGADVNMQLQLGRFGSALAAAVGAAYQETNIVELLLKSGANVNMQLQVGDYGSALAVAVAYNNRDIAELLLKSGADVNMQLQVGDCGSALAVAVAYNNRDIAELLLHSGADMNMQLQFGEYGSALAAAAAYNNRDIVELLLHSGADINMQLQFGEYGSALAATAAGRAYRSTGMAELLLESGANVNMQLQDGKYGSALAAAAGAVYGNHDMVDLLLNFGADVNMELQFGDFRSALEAAGDETSIVKLLTRYGAVTSEIAEDRVENETA